MMIITGQTSWKIRLLSFIYAVFIVGAHAGHNSTLFSHRLFPGILIFCGVPYFFFISGLLMFKSYDLKLSWWTYSIKKRLFTLYVPYILWNVIYTILKFVQAGCKGDVGVASIVLPILGLDIFSEPPCGPFWYIRALLFFMLAAPILGWMLKNPWWGGGVVVLFAFCNMRWPSIELLHTGIKPSSLFWFLSGAYMALNLQHFTVIREWLRKRSLIVYAIFAGLYLWGMMTAGWHGYFRQCLIMTTLFSSWLICPPPPPFENIPRFVGDLLACSFFMYAIHPLVITAVRLMVPNCDYYIVWILAVIISLSIGMLLRRYLHWVYLVLVGGR